MENLQIGRGFLILILVLTLTGFSQSIYNGVGHIPLASQVDWTNAGLYGPISVADHILYITDFTGSYDARIQAAIDSANNLTGITIIYFPAGNYVFQQTINLSSNIIIQGEGSELTFFKFDNDKCSHGFSITGSGPQNQKVITSNIAKTETVINVVSTNGYEKDDWIFFVEEENPDAWVPNPNLPGGGRYAPCGQISRITLDPTGTSITIKDETTKEYLTGNQLFLYEITPTKNVGIENLSIERLPDGNGKGKGITINFVYAVNCWVRGVELKKAFERHININASSHIEISGCYINDAYSVCSGESCGGGKNGFGYGLTLINTSTNCLIENNVFRKLRHSMLTANGANCNVFTYNYSREKGTGMFGCLPSDGDLVLHSQYSYANLFEQNWVEFIQADDVHGNNGPYNAFIRNIVYYDPGNVWDTISLDNAPHSSVLGNMIWDNQGCPLTLGGSTTLDADLYGKIVYASPPNNTYETGLPYDHCLFWLSSWGWEDPVLEDVSYYYSSEPDFLDVPYTNYTWPSCGPPTFSGPYNLTQSIPARDRWFNPSIKTYIAYPTSSPITLSGSLSSDEEWSGNIPLEGNVTIPDNITLTITPGTVITFPDGIKMYVQGTLMAQGENITFNMGDGAELQVQGLLNIEGTALSKITFKSSYANPTIGQYWYAINFTDSADDNSYIKHAVIEHAFLGIIAINASPAIEDNTVRNCHIYGIRLDYAISDVKNNIVENTNIFAGIYLRYSDPLLDGNVFRNNSQDGLYLYSSDPRVAYNTITGNNRYGINCYRYSSPTVMPYFVYPVIYGGHNVIRSNGYGVYASNNSSPLLGKVSEDYLGMNSIHYNTNKAVKAVANSDVDAIGNWWGLYPPLSSYFEADASSSINYGGALDYDPNYYSKTSGKNNKDLVAHEITFPKLPATYKGLTPRELLLLARKLRVKALYPSALKTYRQLIHKFGYEKEARLALAELVSTFREAKLDSSVFALQDIMKTHPNNAMVQVAHDLLTGEYLRKGRRVKAIEHAHKILTNYPASESEKAALFDLFNIYFFDINDPDHARTYLALLERNYPGDELTIHAKILMSGNGGGSFATLNVPVALLESSTQIPQRLRLMQNYPNPFNPSTAIRYSIPRSEYVTLKVYDLLGKEVTTLVNSYQPAGFYSVEFDGTSLSSGIYMYNIKAGEFTESKKMLLTK